ncbi:uncharacterized protein FA14DRAFT_154768 [Meira miltonrushii]|uniref:DUF1771-domain-containing protein n=1 Tax=Meira miltonrushii TaxID=1280837 RepID=A0A316VGA1_9BASI|nr:uncharacterized protein FA14DRAFT_154768 [Meira miltonrushii]PWN35353.1 hypothetical protein FA14DRAFT_154768 [Meira miltonrushii]
MKNFNFLFIHVLLLLHPYLCFSASSSKASQKGKAKAEGRHDSSQALERAMKEKAKAERKTNLYYSNVDDALAKGVSMGHPGYDAWVHLAGEHKKIEANAKAHQLASKFILKNRTPHQEIFQDRAEKLDHSAGQIEKQMDLAKANNNYDLALHNTRLHEHHERVKEHDDTMAGLDETIRELSHSKSRKRT